MKKQRAFTLIELLVVIAIIALLVSILLPSLEAAKRLAKDVVCFSNTKAISLAVQMYAEENDGELVPAIWAPHPKNPAAGTAWFWDFLSANFLVTESWEEWDWQKSPMFHCPVSDSSETVMTFAANRSVMYGAYAWGSGILRLENIKGDTALIMDSNGQMGLVHPSSTTFWLNNYTTDPDDTWVEFRHSGDKANVVMASGAAQAMTRDELEDPALFSAN